MQQRLMRSRSEVIIAGVCGGLGEYFGVDPVIVRLIFALVTLTTGLGLIIYPALWIAMPKAPLGSPSPFREPSRLIGTNEQFNVVQRERERATSAARYGDAPPPPSAYNYDPITGERINANPTVGQTTQLPDEPIAPEFSAAPFVPNVTHGMRRQRRLGRWFALGLIAFGGLILADQIGLNLDFVFPVLMIVIGAFLLRRK